MTQTNGAVWLLRIAAAVLIQTKDLDCSLCSADGLMRAYAAQRGSHGVWEVLARSV
jgi:hypothetical protein